MNATNTRSSWGSEVNSGDIELQHATPMPGFAGAGALENDTTHLLRPDSASDDPRSTAVALSLTETQASSVEIICNSHLPRPDRASGYPRPPTVTPGFTGNEASSDDATGVSRHSQQGRTPRGSRMHANASGASSAPMRANWRTSWIWEISSLVVSAAFMIAIVVVLGKRIDGKPRSSWTLPLAPNTVIALFSTLSKSAILLVITACISQLKWIYFGRRGHRVMDLQIFDDASRGPLGAISLIVRIRWGATIASLGALLIILALAQDAFYQQIYSTYSSHTEQLEEVASLAVTRCQYAGAVRDSLTCKFCRSCSVLWLTKQSANRPRTLGVGIVGGNLCPQNPRLLLSFRKLHVVRV
jgi:hypothetical protein